MKCSCRKLPQILTLVALIFSIITDYLSKEWALQYLADGEEKPLLGQFITLKLIFNPGAAFSFLANNTWIFTLFSILVLTVIAYVAMKITSPWWGIALGLLGGGAVGNLVDRLIRPPALGSGHVVDFLNWNDWFIGNVADIWIVLAAGMIFLLALLNHPAYPQESQTE